MKLEQQLTSLELSKRLKELGVRQESIFYWQQGYKEMKGTESASFFEVTQVKTESKKGMRCFSAFTVAELGELLPRELEDAEDEEFSMSIERHAKGHGMWAVIWTSLTLDGDVIRIDRVPIMPEFTMADAMAKMLIYLIENDILPAPSERG